MKTMLKTMVLALVAILVLAVPVTASEYPMDGTGELTKTDFYVSDASGSAITLSVATQDDGITGNNEVSLTIDGVDFGTVTIPDEPHASYDVVSLPLSYLDSKLVGFDAVAGEEATLTVVLGTITDSITIHVSEEFPTLLASGLIDEIDYEDEAAPGDEISVTIELATDEGDKYEDVTIEAWIVDEDGDRVTDREETHEFNIGKTNDDDDEERTIVLDLPANVDEGDYYVIVEVEGSVDEGAYEGRSGLLDTVTMNDDVVIEVERDDHAVDIENVAFDSTVTTGETVDMAVTLENVGLNDEEVRVRVTIPELGIVQTSDFIVVEEDELVTAYFTTAIPGTAEAGEYTMSVKIYNDDFAETSNFEITVRSTAAPAVTGLTISVDSTTKTVSQTGGVYAITVTNNGNDIRTLNFEVAGVSDWATASVNPGTVVVQPGTSKIVSVFVSPMSDARGAHQFTVFVKEGASVAESLTMTASIAPTLISWGDMNAERALKWVIGFLVLVLVVLFVVWSWRKEEAGGKRRKGYY